MNRKHLLLPSLGLATMLLCVGLIKPKTATNPKYLKLMKEESERESYEIKGAQEYDMMMRGNQFTHTINPEDVNKVINEINARPNLAYKKTRAFDVMKWESRGPNNVGGRTRALIVDKDSSNKLYMGGVNGGLFMSKDNGGSWNKITGNDSSFGNSVASICQAANGDIYYGTGEGFYMASGQFGTGQLGTGVYKSVDGGVSFQRLTATIPANVNSSGNWSYVNRLAAHPTDANKIFAAISGGLFVTNNAGSTWAKPTGLTISTMFLDVEMSSDGDRVIASTNSGLYISNDGGTSFGSNIMGSAGSGLPSGAGLSRIDLAIAPSNKDIMYAVTVRGSDETLEGVYKSIDAGVTWSKILAGGSNFGASDVLGTQGYYDIAFGVHPTNANLIFLGGQLSMYRYISGASSNNGWTSIAYWVGNSFTGDLVHADMHGIVFNKSNPEEMYVITDGGFFKTNNSSDVNPFFVEKNKNYITSQPYGVSANYLGHFMIGTQDQGSWLTGKEVNSETTGRKLTGGDGTRNYMSDLAPDIVFASIIQGQILRAGDGGQSGASFNSIYDPNIDSLTPGSSGNNPDGLPDDGGQWVTPFDVKEALVDGKPRGNLVLGTNKNIFLTQDALGNNPIWFRLTDIAASNGFSAITLSEDGKTVFAGTATGLIYRVKMPSVWDNKYQHTDTLTNIAKVIGGITSFPLKSQIEAKVIRSTGRFVTDLDCNATGDTLVFTLGNYGNTDYVYKSTNAQDSIPTFTVIDGNMPNFPVYSVVFISGSTQKIVLGTEFGIWGTSNGGTTWDELNRMTPNPADWHPRTAVYELIKKKNMWLTDNGATNTGIHKGYSLFSGTHGRGVFLSTSLSTSTLWPTSAQDMALNIGALDVYPNPAHNTLYLNYMSEQASTVVIRVVSYTGVVMQSYTKTVQPGKNVLDLNTESLATGSYLVTLADKGKKASTKFTKQ